MFRDEIFIESRLLIVPYGIETTYYGQYNMNNENF